MTRFIPGLERDHFTRENHRRQVASSFRRPTLTKSKVYQDGKTFYFSWTAESHGEEIYYLQATGNVCDSKNVSYAPKWWGFECRCTCREFQEQESKTVKSNYMKNHVCKHLDSALESSLDPGISKSGPIPSYEEDIEAPHLAEENIDSPTRNTDGLETKRSLRIPGLTELHFTNDSTRMICSDVPAISRVEIDHEKGDFDVEWVSNGTGGFNYEVHASGNILNLQKKIATPHWWGFTVSCDCPDFHRQRKRCRAKGFSQNFVCQHLGAALTSAIDDEKKDKRVNSYATFLV